MPSKRKVLAYGVLAILVAIGFWLAGYFSFKTSSDWAEVQQMLSESGPIHSRVGPVKDISLSPFDFYYRFSGTWAEARLHITVHGANGVAHFEAELRKSSNMWEVVRITDA